MAKSPAPPKKKVVYCGFDGENLASNIEVFHKLPGRYRGNWIPACKSCADESRRNRVKTRVREEETQPQ